MSEKAAPSRIPPNEKLPHVEKPSLPERVVASSRQVVAARMAIVREAGKVVGSFAWSAKANKPPYPAGTNKCNLFVFDMLAQAGIPVRMLGRVSLSGRGIVKYPPLAEDWADPNVKIPKWEVVQPPPLPGDVAAVKMDLSDASGHVGIVVAPGKTVSASSLTDQVEETNWGFTPEVVYRRYIGDLNPPPPEKVWTGRMQ